jgi:hypothetical protein
MENGRICGGIELSEDFKLKLGSVSMYCKTHEEEMMWINDKEAICPHCLGEELKQSPKWVAFMARVWLEKYKKAKKDEEE